MGSKQRLLVGVYVDDVLSQSVNRHVVVVGSGGGGGGGLCTLHAFGI